LAAGTGSYTAQWTTNLAAADWMTYTNLVGDGGTNDIFLPLPLSATAQRYFRVSRP